MNVFATNIAQAQAELNLARFNLECTKRALDRESNHKQGTRFARLQDDMLAQEITAAMCEKNLATLERWNAGPAFSPKRFFANLFAFLFR